MAAGSTALFFRDLVRSARRGRTFILRGITGLVLFLFVIAVWTEQVGSSYGDPVRMARMGGEVFTMYAFAQLGAAFLLGPILVAGTLAEERETGSLQLVAITRLSGRQILLGKVISRIAVVELIILAAFPAQFIIASLGGVSPVSILSALLQATSILLAGGAIATFLSLFTRRALLASGVAWVILLGLMSLSGLPLMAITHQEQDYAALSTFGALLDDTSRIWGPAVFMIMVAGAAIWLALPLFEVVISGGEGDAGSRFGELSYAIWDYERAKRRIVGAGIAMLASSPFALVYGRRLPGWLGRMGSTALAPWLRRLGHVLVWLWPAMLALVAFLVTLMACKVLLLMLADFGNQLSARGGLGKALRSRATSGRKRAKSDLVQNIPASQRSASGSAATGEAVTGQATPAASHAGGSGARKPGDTPKAKQAASRTGRATAAARSVTRALFGGEVVGNPIAWRDIATRSYGPLVSLSKWGYLLLFGCLLLMAIAGVFREDEASLAFSFLFWMAGIGLGCLLSAASLAGERRSDTLSVLSVSTLSSSRILLGKLQGVLFHVGPLLFLGAFFGALYQLDNLRGGGPWASEFGPLLFYRVPGIQGLAIGAWLVAFGGALLICCQAVGLWIRPRLALPAVLVAPILFGVAAGLLTVLDERLMELVMYLLIPLLNGGVWSRHPGVPPEMLISTLAWATLGTAVFAFEVVTLRSRA